MIFKKYTINFEHSIQTTISKPDNTKQKRHNDQTNKTSSDCSFCHCCLLFWFFAATIFYDLMAHWLSGGSPCSTISILKNIFYWKNIWFCTLKVFVN